MLNPQVLKGGILRRILLSSVLLKHGVHHSVSECGWSLGSESLGREIQVGIPFFCFQTSIDMDGFMVELCPCACS